MWMKLTTRDIVLFFSIIKLTQVEGISNFILSVISLLQWTWTDLSSIEDFFSNGNRIPIF